MVSNNSNCAWRSFLLRRTIDTATGAPQKGGPLAVDSIPLRPFARSPRVARRPSSEDRPRSGERDLDEREHCCLPRRYGIQRLPGIPALTRGVMVDSPSTEPATSAWPRGATAGCVAWRGRIRTDRGRTVAEHRTARRGPRRRTPGASHRVRWRRCGSRRSGGRSDRRRRA